LFLSLLKSFKIMVFKILSIITVTAAILLIIASINLKTFHHHPQRVLKILIKSKSNRLKKEAKWQ